jgi:hypothetical protein
MDSIQRERGGGGGGGGGVGGGGTCEKRFVLNKFTEKQNIPGREGEKKINSE